ncbi:EamA domain-containing membrane protein RarD [Xaviernesmea oryzae]|uniref:EamA domain-containing membrane protein RarD n=1 Tax=Xaviernesmea oryzae TaxID=464029 RepID=A0A1X7CL13_9HYPH|nr:DMT family transporter [Xaviernesmea oryzae]SME98578.1 EamA domain-containing membrane protein RarD [Xaviernesmea oryzae]
MKTPYGLGILLVTLSYFVFSTHDAVIKLLVEQVTVWQILFFRSVTVCTCCLLIGGPRLAHRAATSNIVKPMAIRSLFLITAWLSYYTAAKSLQLGELTTLYFAAPVVATLLAGPMLKEHVTLARWIAVIVGFAGVIVASNPVGLTISLPVYLALQAACLWAFSTVLLRRTALHETSLVQMTITNFFFILLTAGMLIVEWKHVDFATTAMLFGVGLLGGLAQYSFFEGMRRAPVSVLAPFEYTALVWAFVLGYLIWGDVPAANVTLGAVLIGGAGLLIIFGERFGRKASTSEGS